MQDKYELLEKLKKKCLISHHLGNEAVAIRFKNMIADLEFEIQEESFLKHSKEGLQSGVVLDTDPEMHKKTQESLKQEEGSEDILERILQDNKDEEVEQKGRLRKLRINRRK